MPLKPHSDELPGLNLTPLIDVLFLLIMFFMAGSSFSDWERDLSVQLPSVSSNQPPSPRAHYVIALDQSGAITLNNEPVTAWQLDERLRKLREATPQMVISIRGDARCPLQAVAAVLNACRQAGVDRTGIAVQPLTVAATKENTLPR